VVRGAARGGVGLGRVAARHAPRRAQSSTL